MPSLVDMNNVLKKMMSNSGYRYKVKGKEKVLKNLPLDQAVKYLNRLIDAQVDPKNFQKHLTDFRKKKAAGIKGGPEHFKTHLEGNNAEMQKRYDYSAECRRAMLEVNKRHMGKPALWDKTVCQVFGTTQDGKPAVHVASRRWMNRLLRMDGSPEGQAHNEKLVTLAAWCNREIDADRFQEIRTNYYQKTGKTETEAQRLAREEREYGMDALLDMYKQKVSDTYHNSDLIMKAGCAVLSGDCKNPEAAYEILLDAQDGIYLGFNAMDTINNIIGSNALNDGENRKEGLLKDSLRYEGLLGRVKAVAEMATDLVPSPQYAYLDPADMQKAGLGMMESTSMTEDWDVVYANGVSQDMDRLLNFTLEERMSDFGLPGDPDALLSTPDTRVYRDEETGRTLIVDIENLDLEHDFKGMQVNENVPGRLLNKHLKEDVENWLDDLKELIISPKYAHSSLKMQLETVRDTELSDAATGYEIMMMRRALKGLQDYAVMYQRELGEMTEAREDDPESYEETEKFIRDLSLRVDNKMKQLDAVEKSTEFLENYRIDDNLEAVGAERVADGEGTRKIMDDLLSKLGEQKNGGPILDMNADENIIQTDVLSPEQAAEKMMNEAGDHDTLEVTQNDFKSRYLTAAEQYKAASERFDAAASSSRKKLSAEQRMTYLQDEAKWENYVNQFGKQWMASEVVGELLELESKLPEEKRPMHTLANAGKFDDLVEMVRNSDKFVEEISVADLSQPGEIERMMKQRAPKNIAKIIMRNYLASEKQRKNAPKPGDGPQKAPEKEQPKNNPIIV